MLLRLLGNLFRLLVLPFLLLRRARVVGKSRAYVHLALDGAVKDVAAAPRFWQVWRRESAASLVEIGKLVDELLRDTRPRGLVVTLRSFKGGMASATSLRAVLARVPEAGRELVVYLPLGADTKELYVASVATRIVASPQSMIAPIGFSVAVQYGSAMLERAGVEPEVYARGKFKSAGEQLVRDSMSEPQREQLGAVLDAFFDEAVRGIADGRKLDPAKVRALIDGAPYRAEEAVAAGLIDAAAYEDDVAALAQGAHVSSARYLRVMRAPRWRHVRRPAVLGVVLVHGPIASRASSAPLLGDRGALDESVIAAVRAARLDPRVRAVVLHVDSPGGSALASDRMHHELERLAAEKPLVACFADTAASGGYYVAACAHVIVAQPTTVTGSIGVIAARVVVEPLLGKLGVATSVVTRGVRADGMQPFRHLSDDERAAFERELEGMYQTFVGIVARGRKRPRDEISRLAQGRVWSGKDAAREGLVDHLGGFHVACDRARELAAKTMGQRATALDVAVVRGGRHAPPPPPALDAKQAALALLGELGLDPGIAVAVGSRERVLAWSNDAAAIIG
jgi:protease-4